MATTLSEHRRHRWADVVVIVAAMYCIAAATWFPPEMISGGTSQAVGQESWNWIAYAAGGVLAVVGLFVALKWEIAGKGMVGLAGLVVLAGFLTLDAFTLTAVLSLGLTGVVLLRAAPFVGAMPTPEQEGKARIEHPERLQQGRDENTPPG